MIKYFVYCLRISLASIALLFAAVVTSKAQSIDRVYGSDCVGNQNEFEFDCSNCTFVQWQISGSYTVDNDSGDGIIDMHWNSPGANSIKAIYSVPGLSYNLNVEYDVTVTSPLTPAVSLHITSTLPSPLCSSSYIQFAAAPTNGGTAPTYDWYINGTFISSSSSTNTFAASHWSNNDAVTVQMASSLNCTTLAYEGASVSSSPVTIGVFQPPVGTLTIANPGTICSLNGTSSNQVLNMFADATDNNSSPIYTNVPTYTWLRNGVMVNSSEYTSTIQGSTYNPSANLQGGETIQCTLLSNDVCASTTPLKSNVITISTISAATPVVSISADKSAICSGDAVTFTFSSAYTPTGPFIINGSTSLSPGQAFVFNNYDGSNVNASVTVSGSCLATTLAQGTFAGSQIAIHPLPVASLSPVGQLKICSTCTQVISASGDQGPSQFQWYNGGVPIPAATASSYTAALGGTYTAVATTTAFPCTGHPSIPLNLVINVAPIVTVSNSFALTLPNNSISITAAASDPDGSIRSVAWVQTSGSTVTLSGATTNILSLSNLVAGSYGFRFTATDDFGESVSVITTVTVSYPPNNYNYIQESTVEISGEMVPSNLVGLPVEQLNVHTTYFDGLGRPMQSVTTQGSPLKHDMVQPVIYDPYGRESKKYLPYSPNDNSGYYKTDPVGQVSGNYSGSPQQIFYQGTTKVASDSAYAMTAFEPSPLNRVAKQGAPGINWQPDDNLNSTTDHTVKHSYEINGATDVILFKYDPVTGYVSTGAGAQPSFYGVNQLVANRSTDEQQNDVIEYVDKLGRTVCKKVQSGTDGTVKLYASTYYIYDNLNNLVVVLPPEAINSALSSLTTQN